MEVALPDHIILDYRMTVRYKDARAVQAIIRKGQTAVRVVAKLEAPDIVFGPLESLRNGRFTMETKFGSSSLRVLMSLFKSIGRYGIAFVILITLCITCDSQKKGTAPARNSALNAEEIAKKILPSVVLIICEDGKGNTSLGSGFFVKAPKDELDKLLDSLPTTRPQAPKARSAGEHRGPVIVTSYHVIKGMIRGTVRIAIDHRRQNWRISDILNYDEQSDLALLGLDEYDDVIYSALSGSRIRPLPLAPTTAVKPGQTVYVLGNPEGLVGSISQGIISAAPRAFKGGARIQLTAAISPGSSGGPAVNSTGEVVGIAQFFLEEGQNLNFAVPVSFLSQLLDRTPSVPRFDDWERASKQRKSEEDWLWLPPKMSAAAKPDDGLDAGIVPNETTPKTSEPSREETSSWLKERLEGSSNYSPEGVQLQITRLSFSFSQLEKPPSPPLCTMDVTIKLQGDSFAAVDVYSLYLILAEKAEPGRSKDGRSGVWLYFRHNVSYEHWVQRKEEMKTDFVMLPTRDEELAVRASKALGHLVSLCGGGPKKEPF